MASLADSNDEESLALALRLSQLSSDEQIAQSPHGGSVSPNHISRPRTPISDKNDLALALGLSLLPSDEFNDQVARLRRTRSAPTSVKARSPTPPKESDENTLELALNLSQLPADIFDEQVSELNRPRESPTAVEDSLGSLLTAMSVVEVRMTPSVQLNKSLKIVLERYARRSGCPAGLGVER
jgi:hypothetical protein